MGLTARMAFFELSSNRWSLSVLLSNLGLWISLSVLSPYPYPWCSNIWSLIGLGVVPRHPQRKKKQKGFLNTPTPFLGKKRKGSIEERKERDGVFCCSVQWRLFAWQMKWVNLFLCFRETLFLTGWAFYKKLRYENVFSYLSFFHIGKWQAAFMRSNRIEISTETGTTITSLFNWDINTCG